MSWFPCNLRNMRAWRERERERQRHCQTPQGGETEEKGQLPDQTQGNDDNRFTFPKVPIGSGSVAS